MRDKKKKAISKGWGIERLALCSYSFWRTKYKPNMETVLKKKKEKPYLRFSLFISCCNPKEVKMFLRKSPQKCEGEIELRELSNTFILRIRLSGIIKGVRTSQKKLKWKENYKKEMGLF